VLADQPLMKNVLADLALESEAATAVTMRVARAYDEGDAPFRRIATAVMKHYVCKRAPGHAGEALECLGGNGYVEESGMPRLLRDSPLNSIWEGSGNVSALDVLRALVKEPEALPAFLAECELARGSNAALDAHLDRIAATQPQDPEFEARSVVSDLAVALQAGLLVRHAPAAVSDAFCASRLTGVGRAYGTLPPSVDADAIIARALPA
jgi:putative acyl-CoA dehydrogenase